MKNMQNFAAQQLSKKQMNEVMGGAIDNCGTLYYAVWIGGGSYVCEKDSAALAEYLRMGAQIIEADHF